MIADCFLAILNYIKSWFYYHFGLPLITYVRCHVRTTASETEALALPVFEFGTVCHVACEHLTSSTDILKHHWRHICLTRPQRFVTFYISALEILLLTYLLVLMQEFRNFACVKLTWMPVNCVVYEIYFPWTSLHKSCVLFFHSRTAFC